MTIPTRDKCFILMTQFEMPDHIRRHSLLVARVATMIATDFGASGLPIDVELVERSALLHDIGKAQGLVTKEDHGVLGAKLLTDEGYDELAPIVRGHIGLTSFDDDEPFSETLIVNYSDKRVMHDTIVSLEVRFNDLEERYARDETGRTLVAQMLDVYRRLESAIFRELSFNPGDLADVLQSSKNTP